MAHIFETRCASGLFRHSPHMLRVACIGDSMMYGQGVTPRQTLPAHLARFLNAAITNQLVWVDNFGESSGNVWDAWTLMKQRLESQHFDAIIFSVCNNDPILFDTMLEYPDSNPSWDEDSIQFRQLAKLFGDMRDVCRQRAIIPTVLFYSLLSSDENIVTLFSRLIAGLEIINIEVFSFFREQMQGDLDRYIASEFDGHPSSLTHELVARRITTELMKRLKAHRPGEFTTDPVRVAGAALSDLVDQGVAPDSALDWATEAIAAKRRAARRHADGGQFLRTTEALSVSLRHCEQGWRLSRRIEAGMQLMQPTDLWNTSLPNLFMFLIRLESVVFTLEIARNSAEMAELEALLSSVDGYFERRLFGPPFTGDIGEALAIIRDRLAQLQAVGPAGRIEATEFSRGTGALMRQSLDIAAASWHIGWLVRLQVRIKDILATLEGVAARFEGVGTEGAPALWTTLVSHLNWCMDVIEQLDGALCAAIPMDTPIGRPWTCVDVTLEGGPDPEVTQTVCGLTVEADYRVPVRHRLREKLWAGTASGRAVYHFELPLLILGDLRVGVFENDPTRQRFLNGTARIVKIDIYNAPPDEGFDGPIRMVPAREASAVVPVISWGDPDSCLPLVEFPGIVLP